MASTVADLEARLAAGQDVTPAELAEAEATERLARLRVEAATRAAVRRREAARRERIAAVRRELPARLDRKPMDRAQAKLAAAVDEYLRACVEFNEEQAAAAEELRGLGELPPELAVDQPRYGSIEDGGTVYRPARPQTVIAGVVVEAIKRHYPRRTIRLDNPQD